MTLRNDELENNVFFKLLQTKFVDKFRLAQERSCIIAVPCQESIKGLCITEEFIDIHTLKPSPFLKSHYIPVGIHWQSFELDGGVIKTLNGNVKILADEIAYSEEYKPYKILIIEKPLAFAECKDKYANGSYKVLDEKEPHIFNYQNLSVLCPEIAKKLEKRVTYFNTSYMILPEYLYDAASRLHDIIEWASNAFTDSMKSLATCGENAVEVASSIELHVLSQVHQKLFSTIKDKFYDEDKEITQRLFSLHEGGLTPDQLGVNDLFCCPTPSAVVELASLDSKLTPNDKLLCLMTTLELLNHDIEDSLHNAYALTDIPHITSDDLIPLLINVMVRARPLYLASNLYYMQNFCWNLSENSKFSFSLTTFQAAKEYLKSKELYSLKPSSQKVKKELSLEELMTVTMKMQMSNRVQEVNSSLQAVHSTIDHQLESITKMIEASTKELREINQSDDENKSNKDINYKQEKVLPKDDESMGGFLSYLQQNSLGFSYGKKL